MDWQRGMNRAVDYIESNLSGDIHYECAAQCVMCSVWEFRRVFSLMAQMSVSEYVRRRRLTLAAHDIQANGERIIEIALRYGYDSQSAFSRAFSQLHGVSPSAAREDGVTLKTYPRLTFKFVLLGVDEMKFKIEKKEAFDVIGYTVRTTDENGEHYHDIGAFWNCYLKDDSMWNTLQPYARNPDEGYSYAVSSYDNDIKTSEFWYTVGVPYNGLPNRDKLKIIHIPAGAYAIFQMPSGEEIGAYTERIFSEWLPASGYQLTGGPELERSSKEEAFVWLPVKERQV